jgi:hypothetical protein
MSPAIVRIGERVWSMRARFAALAVTAVTTGGSPRRTGYAYLSRIFALHPRHENRVAGRARNPLNFFQAGHHVP